jgi:hypothetical protein
VRQLLIAAEVALTVVLVSSAGLLIRTLVHLETMPSGFNPSGLIAAQASLDDVRYDESAFRKLLNESLANMRKIPGVQDAAVGLSLPYQRAIIAIGITLNDGALSLANKGRAGGKRFMRLGWAFLLLYGSIATSQVVSRATQQSSIPSGDGFPSYWIAFQRGDPVAGLNVSPAISMPIQCSSDGTAYLDMLQLPDFRSHLLESLSLSRETHAFRPEQAPGLYDMRIVSHYVLDTGVVFLVEAAQEDEKVKGTVVTSDGQKREETRNLKEHHYYAVGFEHDGSYRRQARVDGELPHFTFEGLGIFPSGMMLAYGFDTLSNKLELVLLNSDGRVAAFVESLASAFPRSAFLHESNGKESIRLAPVQLVSQGRGLLVVQNSVPSRVRSSAADISEQHALVEVTESGAVRVIQPKLPEDARIQTLISSDRNIYARTMEAEGESIYELDPQDGRILGRYMEAKGTAFVACVHDGRFLAFDHPDANTLLPVFGSPQPLVRSSLPAASAAAPK